MLRQEYMNFLNPLVLFGLFAASIPVLLHLLNLRKLKTVEFSSIRFLLDLQKTKIKKVKLKQILLLILRTLIIIFAVLAFARPAIKGTLPGFESYSKTSAIIILDNSFSMDVSDEYGNRFNQAKKAVRSILKNLKEGDEAVVIEMANMQNRSQYAFSRNFDYLDEKLSAVKIAQSSANLDKSLAFAATVLENSANLNKEIYIISDAQPNIFKSEDSLKIKSKGAGIYFVAVGNNSKADIQNSSIDSLRIISAIFQEGKAVESEAYIRNSSKNDAKGTVISLMYNGERTAQRSMDIPAGEKRSTEIAASVNKRGVIKAAVELENDAFDYDNKKYFGFAVPEKAKTALIGSGESITFLNLILGGNSGTDFADTKIYSPNDFAGVDLNNIDLLIIAGTLTGQSDYDRLDSYIRSGGNALIFADNTDKMTLFAKELSKLGFGSISAKSFADNQPGRFIQTDKLHPLFEGVFKGETNSKSNIESPEIKKAYPSSMGQMLIEMSGGAFLAESRQGEGKVIYCAVSPDAQMSNFPLTGLFPAFVYRTVLYLTAAQNLSHFAVSGKSFSIVLPKRFGAGGNFKIIDPSGGEYFQAAAQLPQGAVLAFDNLQVPGVYTVYNSVNRLVSIISVNLESDESDFSKIEKDNAVQNMNQRFTDKPNIEFIDDIDKIKDGILRSRTGTELWQLFLILALLCAVAEMIVQKVSKADAE